MGEPTEEAQPLRVGDLIHGFAQGAFGRDFYECAHVEALGTDWVAVRDLDGAPWFTSGRDRLERAATARGPSDYPHHSNCPDLEES